MAQTQQTTKTAIKNPRYSVLKPAIFGFWRTNIQIFKQWTHLVAHGYRSGIRSLRLLSRSTGRLSTLHLTLTCLIGRQKRRKSKKMASTYYVYVTEFSTAHWLRGSDVIRLRDEVTRDKYLRPGIQRVASPPRARAAMMLVQRRIT